MKREYTGFLLILMVLDILLSGCSNTQPTKQTTMTESKKNELTGQQQLDLYMKKRYTEVLGYTEDEYFKYVANPNYNKKYNDYKKLGLTRYEYFGEVDNSTMDLNKYGVYYTGDGGHFPFKIEVLVYKSKVNEAIKEINNLNNLISSVKMHDGKFECQAYGAYERFLNQSDDGYQYIGLPKNVNLNNTVCLAVKTYPEREVDATLSLRKLNTVLYAIRPGMAAGGSVAVIPVENFEGKGEEYLKKQNQLDNVKLTKNQDDSLKSNFVNKK